MEDHGTLNHSLSSIKNIYQNTDPYHRSITAFLQVSTVAQLKI